jgi:hypothetical protein
MAKLVKQAKKLGQSITGFSTPIFGLQWQPPKTDRGIVRDVLIFLEDRRVLYNPHAWEIPDHVAQSLIEIRERLTSQMSALSDDAPAYAHFSSMRAACRQYLNSAGEDEFRGRRRGYWNDQDFSEALGKLRATIGMHVAALCEEYGIEVEDQLASMFPSSED